MSQASSSSFTFFCSQATSTPDTLTPNTIADSENEPSTSAKEKPQMQPKFPQSRKRKTTEFETEMLRAAQRLGEKKESEKKEEFDEDELFLKSLVPKMKRMDIANKMACQGKILNIVLEHIIKSEGSKERIENTPVTKAPARNEYQSQYQYSPPTYRQSLDGDARDYQYHQYSTSQTDTAMY